MESEDARGLSEGNRTYIVAIVVLALFVFGLLDDVSSVERIVYLIAIPSGVWVILRFLGSKVPLDPAANDRFGRAITAMFAGVFAFGAFQSYTAVSHRECTHAVPDGDFGSECVGEYIQTAGPDKGKAVMFGVLTCAAFVLAVAKRSH